MSEPFELQPLVTQCPNCHTQFRVNEAQLQVANGKVRCGACLTVFQGVDNLIWEQGGEEAASDAGSSLDDLLEELDNVGGDEAELLADEIGLELGPGESPDESDLSDVELIEWEKADESAPEEAAEVAQDTPSDAGPTPEPAEVRDTDKDSDTDKDTDAVAENDTVEANDSAAGSAASDSGESEPSAADALAAAVAATFSQPQTGSQPLVETDQAQVQPTESAESAEPIEPTEPTEPESAPQPAAAPPPRKPVSAAAARREARAGAEAAQAAPVDSSVSQATQEADPFARLKANKSDELPTPGAERGWKLYAVTLGGLILLLAQVLVFQFDSWTQDPAMRPIYTTLCPLFRCEVPAMQALDQMSSKNLTVRSHPEKEGELIVDTLIVNNAEFPQAFPVLELTFTDLNDKVVAEHRFEPAEYLAGELKGAKAIASLTPVRIKLEIEDPGSKAVSYKMDFR